MICGSCHSLDNENHIIADGEWIKGAQQYDEWLHSPHNTASAHYGYLTCTTCHVAMKSTVYDQGGLKEYPNCSTCHPNHEIPGKEYLSCAACHMPYSVKSTVAFNEYKADVHSHQFKVWITTFPKDSMFYTDSSGTFVKLDPSGQVYGNTLDLVCLRCHYSWSIMDVYSIAEDIHIEGLNVIPVPDFSTPSDFILVQNYPNPFNPTTTIEFSVLNNDFVSLSVFDISGCLVETLVSENVTAGNYKVIFNGADLASGIYVYCLKSSSKSLSRKMILLK